MFQLYFNLILLASPTPFRLFPKSQPVTDDSVQKARDFLAGKQFKDEFGSVNPKPLTETLEHVRFFCLILLRPTNAIFQLYSQDVISEEIPRVMFLLSCGKISRPTKLIYFVYEQSDDWRIYPLSLGEGNFYVV